MSGHSKWSQIKRQKGATDVKRSATFSKLSNAIILAAKNGGDPNNNFSLKMAIEKARADNMPKENIERAIKRGTGEISGSKVEEVLFEGIGIGNIGIIIEALTDNKNRTNSEIRVVLTKFGAKLTGSGAVVYQFDRVGRILLCTDDKSKEELELIAIDAGAENFEEQGDVLAIFTKPHDLENVKKYFENQNLKIADTGLTFEPKNLILIEDQDEVKKVINLLEALESLDDVSAVFTNINLPDE